MPEKKKTVHMKQHAAITGISEETIAKYFIEARPEVHHNTTRARTSLSCAMTRPTTAASGRKK